MAKKWHMLNKILVPDILTSGSIQMVSLLELAEIAEEGVKFKSPYDGNYNNNS